MGKKSKKQANTPANELVSSLHNKWRYYSRKNKNLSKIVALGVILLVFFISKSGIFNSDKDFSAGYIRDNSNDPEYLLDEEGNVVLDESGNPVLADIPEDSMPEEEEPPIDDDPIDEEDEISEPVSSEPGFLAKMFDINKMFSLKARLHEWWTGDNPGYRLISPLSTPIQDRKYDFDSDFLAAAPNPRFVFHNKLPKTGSTTMHNIVGLLSRRNNFTYWKIMSGVMKFGDESTLVQALRMRYREPFFLLQHHYWMDFEKYDMVQPTFVNMIREPVTWFQSHYSFMKYGANSRKANSGVENLSEDIEACIKEEDKLCQGNPWTYIEFFCGSDKFCNQIKNGDEESKAKVVDIAKRRVINQYYVVGILEQFEDTLRMFETMLPDFYSGAMTAWKSDYIQFRRNQTKTIKGAPLAPDAREYLAYNALKYETDFYFFCRFLFNERLLALQIDPSTNTNT